MAVAEEGYYLAERVRALVAERRHGVMPWKGEEVAECIARAYRHSGDHHRFYQAFLDGIRDLLSDDEDRVLAKFTRQAAQSESRVLADSTTTRDHLTHVTQVFLLGWLILNDCPKFRTLGEEWRPYGWPTESRFERLNRAWIFTSLLHDCAYSVEYAKKARLHEVRVRSTFGRVYKPGSSGSIDLEACEEEARALWARRAEVIGCRVSPPLSGVLNALYTFPDHAFVTAQALFRDAAAFQDAPRNTFETAAISLVCHNFRHHLDPRKAPDPNIVEWFSLDFFQEPLAALLTVADEIQDWGRERIDNAFSRDEAREPFAATDSTILTHLSVNDAAGLSIEADLVLRLFPQDRRHRLRAARERERKNATATRTYSNGFLPRSKQANAFNLHLRIRESVEDVPCRVDRRFDWPLSLERSLRVRSQQALASAEGPEPVQETAVIDPTTKATLIELDSGGARLASSAPRPARFTLVDPGGAGKSTLLRELARSTRAVTPIYVEELGDDLTDLFEEASANRTGDSDVLLVIDHLDRLVGTPNESYWLEQLSSLPPAHWLHVVAACRPEEFETVIDYALGGRFPPVQLDRRVGLLMSAVDPDGRATARGIEKYLRASTQQLTVLGQVALAMKRRRFLEHGVPGAASEARFGQAPALHFTNGKLRFAHDAVQDYCAAHALTVGLAEGSSERPDPRLRSLMSLPPDAFRLMLEQITSSRVIERAQRSRAARRLAASLLHEATLRHWLYDTGRLERARHAVIGFATIFGDEGFAGPMLAGLVSFQRFTPTELEAGKREEAQRLAEGAVDGFASALSELHTGWPTDPEASVSAEIATLYIADHLATVLSRAAVCCPEPELARTLQQRALGRLQVEPSISGIAITPARVRALIEAADFIAAPTAMLIELDNQLRLRVDDGQERDAQKLFGLRAYQLAGHIGGTLFLMKDMPRAACQAGIDWQERALARAHRVLRVMSEHASDYETFGTTAAGLADAGRHECARTYFLARALQSAFVEPHDGWFRLLDSIENQEAASRRAKQSLEPGERLPVSYWHGLQDLAFGRAIAGARPGITLEAAAKALEKEERAVVEEYRRWAERHARTGRVGVYDYLRSRIGDPAAFLVRWVR